MVRGAAVHPGSAPRPSPSNGHANCTDAVRAGLRPSEAEKEPECVMAGGMENSFLAHSTISRQNLISRVQATAACSFKKLFDWIAQASELALEFCNPLFELM